MPALELHLSQRDGLFILQRDDGISGDGFGSHIDLAMIFLLEFMLSGEVIGVVMCDEDAF